MSTVPAQSHPLIVAARWLRLVGNQDYRTGTGGAPIFETCSQPDKYLERLATVVAKDGTLNGKSRYAERLAMCLANNRNSVEAARLFEAIVEGEEDILYLLEPKEDEPPIRSAYVAEAVADRPGKLGYEGIYRFATLAMAGGQMDLAKRLFLEIVEKVPTECYPIRLQDIRVASLRALDGLKVKRLTSGVHVSAELKLAEAHQY